MGTTSRTKNKVEDIELLNKIQKKIGLEIKNILTMTLKEVEELNVKFEFLMEILLEMEENIIYGKKLYRRRIK
ncbi:hypothetical protein [Fusobacterium necrophorum]|uniref:hypothetical protein n=1 Tax=Fusobacterium necrophorum TaxID=859 RepID=UPI0021C30C67|nr:hypothetical protein [Fusobacterium necrophorum]